LAETNILTFMTYLTPWEPGYGIFTPGNQPKTSSFRLPCQCHSTSTVCARELFKSSKDSASLLPYTWKKILVGGCRIFV